jgi:tetratricopeptide (TPR) repeat protein
LQLGQKSKALTAFERASRNNYLPGVAKDALLQYAKLSLELNGNSQPMEKYFEKYPNRSADPEIIRYRAALHLSKQQYKKALDELLALPQPTDKEKADIQRLNFLVGQQLYELHSSNYYQEAIRYFDAALNMGRYNARLEASARYHKAEACFMLHNFKEAQPLYENFINSSGAFASGNDYLAAHYNLGYCFFKMKDYDKALSWFRKFITLAGDTFRQQVADAYNRTGDCHYMQGKYWPATDNYGKAADMKAANPDYALYYKAISYGLLNRADRKIETLNELVAAYPQSTYVPQALLERGRTHLQANRYSDAEASFMQLVNNYPASALLPQAYIELGLIRSNTGRLNEAIDYYKDAQRKSTPNSNDEKSALIGLQNAYADLGTPHTYFEYLESIGKETNRNEKEQALYNAAEKSANSGHCEKAIQEFNRFIEEYQGSTLLPQAHYYLANCYYQNSNFALAATHYQYTAQQAKDIAYKELSLLKSSQANTQLENYEAALENLRALVALSDNQNHLLTAYMNMAQLQAHQLHNHREAANSAQSALSFEGINNRQAREMKLIKANSWNTLGQTDAAMEVYQEITAEQQKDLENAEATYHLIAHTFAQGDFNEGENKVVAFSKTEPSRYWVARCYILLAGEYAKRGNEVQALATYESILNGYTNPADGIRETVQQQIDLLKNKDTQ